MKNIASNRKNILSLNRQFKVAGGCRARFCDSKHNTKQKNRNKILQMKDIMHKNLDGLGKEAGEEALETTGQWKHLHLKMHCETL